MYRSIMPPGEAGREVASLRAPAGVEVHCGTAISARYLLDAGGCGVIIHWTR